MIEIATHDDINEIKDKLDDNIPLSDIQQNILSNYIQLLEEMADDRDDIWVDRKCPEIPGWRDIWLYRQLPA